MNKRFCILSMFYLLTMFIIPINGCAQSSGNPPIQSQTDPTVQTVVLNPTTRRIKIVDPGHQREIELTWNEAELVKLQNTATGSGILLLPAGNVDGRLIIAPLTAIVTYSSALPSPSQAERTPSPLTPPTPTPAPTVTPPPLPWQPQCPPTKRGLAEVQQSLPELIGKYNALRQDEQQGALQNNRIIPVLNAIICDLLAIEYILKETYAPTPEIVERIRKTEDMRRSFESEIRTRLQQ